MDKLSVAYYCRRQAFRITVNTHAWYTCINEFAQYHHVFIKIIYIICNYLFMVYLYRSARPLLTFTYSVAYLTRLVVYTCTCVELKVTQQKHALGFIYIQSARVDLIVG